MFEECPKHPSQEVVGICASCLRDRLYSLKRKNKLRPPSLHNISYSSDSDSCLEFDELRLANFDNKEIGARKKFVWLTKTKNPRTPTRKDKRAFFSFRSIFHRLRRNKEETTPDFCITHDDSFISIKLDGNERSDQWECRTVGSSARSSSVCEGKWPYYDASGFIWKGNANASSYTLHNAIERQEEEEGGGGGGVRGGGGGDDRGGGGGGGSSRSKNEVLRWRTRMSGMVGKKWRVQEKALNECNNQKMWSLSSVYKNYHDSRRCMRSSNGTKKSWLRNLTSPKWRLH